MLLISHRILIFLNEYRRWPIGTSLQFIVCLSKTRGKKISPSIFYTCAQPKIFLTRRHCNQDLNYMLEISLHSSMKSAVAHHRNLKN